MQKIRRLGESTGIVGYTRLGIRVGWDGSDQHQRQPAARRAAKQAVGRAMKVLKKLMLVWMVVGVVALFDTNVAWAKEWWSEEIPFPLTGMHMALGTDGSPYFA